MSKPEQKMLDRMGPDGLARALNDLLDGPKLVKLANACGLKYPGMRTRSQKKQRILNDLVEKSGKNATTLRAIFRQLQKEVRPAAREWSKLDAKSRDERLLDVQKNGTNGSVGRHLFLLASNGDGHDEALKALIARASDEANDDTTPESPATKHTTTRTKATSSRDVQRLQKKVNEQQKKVLHLEGQLTKVRESQKQLKRELAQATAELTESRSVAERLNKELEKRGGSTTGDREPIDASLEKLTRAVRRVGTEQRKSNHALERLKQEPSSELPDAIVAALGDPLKELKRELGAVKRELKRESTRNTEMQESLQEEFKRLTRVRRKKAAAAKTKRTSTEPRVGVFIDVQNVYYGARRLKGKLDFDALMASAVLDRRLILANAYVVESKEIDQSSFLNILQRRAINVRRKSLKVRADGSTKGDWDMELALDILDAAHALDVVVLVSGDGDFTSLAHRVKQIGPRFEVIAFPRNTAKSLSEAADRFQPLDRKFMIYAPRNQRASAPAGHAATATPPADKGAKS